MKLASFIGLAVAIAAVLIAIRTSMAAEPVDVFAKPVPATPTGTSATVLSPGTYFAERSDGVRFSGWVHSPYASQFPMPKKTPPALPKAKMPQRDPQLRFVPVQPQFPTLVRPAR